MLVKRSTNNLMVVVVAAIALVGISISAAGDHFGEPDKAASYILVGEADQAGMQEVAWGAVCPLFGEPRPVPCTARPTCHDLADDEICQDRFVVYGPPPFALCDDVIVPGGVPGLGGVLFCNVPVGSTIAVAVHDQVFYDLQRASVTCLEDEALGGHHVMGEIDGEGVFDLGDDCPDGGFQHPDDTLGTTRVGVLIHGPPSGLGTSGQVTLNVLQ